MAAPLLRLTEPAGDASCRSVAAAATGHVLQLRRGECAGRGQHGSRLKQPFASGCFWADCRYTRATANWQSDRGAGADNVSAWPLHRELRREAKDDRVQLSCEVDTYASFGCWPSNASRRAARSALALRGAADVRARACRFAHSLRAPSRPPAPTRSTAGCNARG